MLRFDAQLPAVYDLPQLVSLTRTRYPSCEAVNKVDMAGGSFIAVYWDNWSPTASSLTAWRADVAAHVPTHPTAAELEATRADNEATLRQRALPALTANDNFIAATKPSTAAAQASAAYDAAVRLSKECNALIQLLLNNLDTLHIT